MRERCKNKWPKSALREAVEVFGALPTSPDSGGVMRQTWILHVTLYDSALGTIERWRHA